MQDFEVHADEVTIIGGGPSLVGFDFGCIPTSHYIIAPNRSAWSAPRADMMVSVDKTFIRNWAAEIADLSEHKVCLLGMPAAFGWGMDFGKAIRLLHRRDIAITPNFTEGLAGLNSGYASLNAAYLLGAKRINLLGFDMKSPVGKHHLQADKHWHEGYEWHHSKHPNIFRTWASQFAKAATALIAQGTEVVNFVGPDGSGISAFHTEPLESFAALGYKVQHEHSIRPIQKTV